MAQLAGAIATQTEGWVFESKMRQTKVVKYGSASSTSKRLTIGESVTGPRR